MKHMLFSAVALTTAPAIADIAPLRFPRSPHFVGLPGHDILILLCAASLGFATGYFLDNLIIERLRRNKPINRDRASSSVGKAHDEGLHGPPADTWARVFSGCIGAGLALAALGSLRMATGL